MSLEEYQALLAQIVRESVQQQIFPLANEENMAQFDQQVQRKKRKVSAYSREFGRQYRALRKKHPRMSHGQITKKAHAATRKIRKPRK